MASSRLNWDDLRLVLALAEAGTLSGAASTLALSHPTLSKRLRAMEDRLGVRLFDRLPGGLVPTQAGQDAIDLAGRMATDIAALEARIAGQDKAGGGVVRLTAPDAIAEYLLPPILAAMGRDEPRLTMELIVSNTILSLAQRKADIALRVTGKPDPGLKGRRIGTVAMAIYAAQVVADLPDGARPWIGYDGSLACAGPGLWLADHVPADRIRFRANTLLGAAQAARSGMGCAVLPCFVGEGLPDLRRLGDPLPGLDQPLWLLVHPDLAGVPRIRAAGTALTRHVRAARVTLSGTA